MLRITPSTSAKGAKEYFTQSLTRDDTGYYHEGQELAGAWGGKGAKMLGLSGEVSQKDYFALCDNRNPRTGEQLTPRNKEDRRVGFNFTFSAPKSVSVLYELSGDEKILDAYRESVGETMREVETEMKTRVRKRGADSDRETGNMVWAEFTHFTARPVDGLPDPHLHTHVYAFNITHDSVEDRWKAGQFGDLKRDATYYEAAFDARLSHKLKALGYTTQKTRATALKWRAFRNPSSINSPSAGTPLKPRRRRKVSSTLKGNTPSAITAASIRISASTRRSCAHSGMPASTIPSGRP